MRNFAEGIDVPWQDFFHTEDRAEVARQCALAGMTCEWNEERLRLNQPAAAVRSTPERATGLDVRSRARRDRTRRGGRVHAVRGRASRTVRHPPGARPGGRGGHGRRG